MLRLASSCVFSVLLLAACGPDGRDGDNVVDAIDRLTKVLADKTIVAKEAKRAGIRLAMMLNVALK